MYVKAYSHPPRVSHTNLHNHNTHKQEKDKNTVPWEYCGYDPPFTPGPFRRNEVSARGRDSVRRELNMYTYVYVCVGEYVRREGGAAEIDNVVFI